MAIEVLCPGCGKRLRVPDAAAGKQGKCPACGQVMQIPAAPAGAQAPEPQEPQEPRRATKRRPDAATRGRTRRTGSRRTGRMAAREGVARGERRPSERTARPAGRTARMGARGRTARMGAKGEKGKPGRRHEFDPEEYARQKKKKIIMFVCALGALVAAAIVLYVLIAVPINRRWAAFRRWGRDSKKYLDETWKGVFEKIPIDKPPQTASTIEALVKTSKDLFKKLQDNVERSPITDYIKALKAYKFCGQVPKRLEDLLHRAREIERVYRDAEEEEWSEERLQTDLKPAVKDYMKAFVEAEIAFNKADLYWAALGEVGEGTDPDDTKYWERFHEDKLSVLEGR